MLLQFKKEINLHSSKMLQNFKSCEYTCTYPCQNVVSLSYSGSFPVPFLSPGQVVCLQVPHLLCCLYNFCFKNWFKNYDLLFYKNCIETKTKTSLKIYGRSIGLSLEHTTFNMIMNCMITNCLFYVHGAQHLVFRLLHLHCKCWNIYGLYFFNYMPEYQLH